MILKCRKWGITPPKFRIASQRHALSLNIARYRGKNVSSIRQRVWRVHSSHTNTHTHKEDLYIYLLCFYILLGSKIGGFQKKYMRVYSGYNDSSSYSAHSNILIHRRNTFTNHASPPKITRRGCSMVKYMTEKSNIWLGWKSENKKFEFLP